MVMGLVSDFLGQLGAFFMEEIVACKASIHPFGGFVFAARRWG